MPTVPQRRSQLTQTTPYFVSACGRYTIYKGDCREIMASMRSESIDMIWTDPPYGHGNHDGDLNGRLNDYRELENKPIANDTQETMREVVDGMLVQAARVLKSDCCCCCCCGGGGPRPTFAWVADRMDNKGLRFFHSVIWDKKNPGLGWRYRRQHEMVMVSHRAEGKLLWADDNKAAPNIFSYMPPRERDHPNEKPIPLVLNFINLHTIATDIVMDPFMGGGTTLVACVKAGRHCIGIEQSEEYCDIAVGRLKHELVQCGYAKPTPPPPVKVLKVGVKK